MAIWRSRSGIVAAVRERFETAVSTSSRFETPPVEPVLVICHRLVIKLDRAPAYFKFQIQLAQSEIGLGYVGHQSNIHAALRLLRGKKDARGCFGFAADSAEDIELPGQAKTEQQVSESTVGREGLRRLAGSRDLLHAAIGAQVYLRIEE